MLSGEFTLRHAERHDGRAIRRLIYQVGINPLDLNWRHFWIIVDWDGKLAACGQIKAHRDGSRELASIAVAPRWRRRGLARAVIEKLLSETEHPLYLTSGWRLGGFYEKFGFETVEEPHEMPAYFRRIAIIAGFIQKLLPRAGRLLVMRRDR